MIILVIIVIVLIYAVILYNDLVHCRVKTEESLSGIDVSLSRR